METHRPRILIVDDQEFVRRDIAKRLASRGERFGIETATGVSDALFKLETFRPDLVLLDLTMPGAQGFPTLVTGLELLSTIKTQAPLVQVVVLTARDEPVIMAEAFQRGAYHYLVKGKFTTVDLLQIVDDALAKPELPAGSSIGTPPVDVNRLRRRRAHREEHLHIYEEKLHFLERELILKTDATEKFKLKKEIEETRQAVEDIEREIERLTAQIAQVLKNDD